MKGFYAKIGPGNALIAEFMALVRGIHLAKDLGLKNVIIESDSNVVIDFFSKGHTIIAPLRPLFDETLRILRLPSWSPSIQIVVPEANICTDHLASSGHRADFTITVIDYPSPPLDLLVSDDMRGSGVVDVILFFLLIKKKL